MYCGNPRLCVCLRPHAYTLLHGPGCNLGQVEGVVWVAPNCALLSGFATTARVAFLNHCLSWSKFVNTHLYHSRQWFNIHICVQQRMTACQISHVKATFHYAILVADLVSLRPARRPASSCRIA